MTTVTIADATAYERDTYGITGRSAYVYRVAGKGLHNASFPHRVVVWDNTCRPNLHRGEPVRMVGEHGKREGGPGAYVDPHGRDTDSPLSVLLSSESVAITAHGANTGAAASGQVYAAETLRVGDAVTLVRADGTELGAYVITARFLGDPVLVSA